MEGRFPPGALPELALTLEALVGTNTSTFDETLSARGFNTDDIAAYFDAMIAGGLAGGMGPGELCQVFLAQGLILGQGLADLYPLQSGGL